MPLRFTEQLRDWTLATLGHYWLGGRESVCRLPLKQVGTLADHCPPELRWLDLPAWADCGVDGRLLVPAHAATGASWEECDWLNAACWFMTGVAERAHEGSHGPLHSNSRLLHDWDSRLWEHAWANRIGLFLRRWAAREAGFREETIFGPKPRPQLLLTHDVEAVKKSLATRLVSSTQAFKRSLEAMLAWDGDVSAEAFQRGKRLLFSKDDWWAFAALAEEEQNRGLRSHFHFYAAKGSRRASGDPAYNASSPEMTKVIHALSREGWTIGIHLGGSSWMNAVRMAEEKNSLEAILGEPVRSCRQHQLRFSWEATWAAQEKAGLPLDTSLGFLDRPGFRNGSAFRMHPVNPHTGRQYQVEVLPLVLADAHVCGTGQHSETLRQNMIGRYCAELKAVGGSASVAWRTHTHGSDFGWHDGWLEVLDAVAEYGLA